MISKHKNWVVVTLILFILTLKVGVMQGTADQLLPTEDTTIVNGALLSDRPIHKSRLTEKAIHITAYSSRPEETDDTPFITASGTRVRDGVVAANWLPIGTKIRIPSLFGDKVFVVEDRMARKNDHKLDIWFSTTSAALRFGVKYAKVEIL